jgi:hypothetical protein
MPKLAKLVHDAIIRQSSPKHINEQNMRGRKDRVGFLMMAQESNPYVSLPLMKISGLLLRRSSHPRPKKTDWCPRRDKLTVVGNNQLNMHGMIPNPMR